MFRSAPSRIVLIVRALILGFGNLDSLTIGAMFPNTRFEHIVDSLRAISQCLVSNERYFTLDLDWF